MRSVAPGLFFFAALLLCRRAIAAGEACTPCTQLGTWRDCADAETPCKLCSWLPGQYFTGAGAYNATSCPYQTAPACPSGQYRRVASGNILGVPDGPGTCLNCTNALPQFNYYSASGGYANQCPLSPCPQCGVGEYRVGCGGASAGACRNCSNAGPAQYYAGPGTYAADSCPTAACPACLTGQYTECGLGATGPCRNCSNAGPSEYYPEDAPLNLNATCNVSACDKATSCGDGPAFLRGCGQGAPGACVACSTCSEGLQFYAIDCQDFEDTVCEACETAPCLQGFYQERACSTGSGTSDSWNQRCLPCRDCAPGREFAPRGYNCEGGRNRVCLNCSACQGGGAPLYPCTVNSDAICENVAGCRTQVNYTLEPWMRAEYACLPGEYLVGMDPAKDPVQQCARCPAHLYGPNGFWCEPCPGYKEPYNTDRTACVCHRPTLEREDGSCLCPAGHAFDAGGCSPCPPNTYNASALVLEERWWLQVTRCAPCPPGYASPAGSTSCDPCPWGTYRRAQDDLCRECSPGSYAPDPTRFVCEPCSADCPALQYKTPCPTSRAHHICEPCDPLPQHARPVVYCDYICEEGYYHDNQTCLACSTRECPPGYAPTPCTLFADGNCDEPCVNATKPLFHSTWTRGCEWGCEEGYVVRWSNYFLYQTASCVPAEAQSFYYRL